MKAAGTAPHQSSATREALIAATEQLMREEGYAAVTSRRVGARAGVRGPTIHYFFKSMDNLYVATLEKVSEAWLREMNEALASEHPLKALWQLERSPERASLAVEFRALANHRPAVREALAEFGRRARALQAAGIEKYFQSHGRTSPIPATAAPVLIVGMSSWLAAEAAIGLSLGHTETDRVIESFLAELEASAD
jgi:AcrR family transcriptional regulator